MIAVGNSGEQQYGNERIQAPSDAVNAIGVGAYTITDTGRKVKAPYSSIGQGREGAKVKPDFLEFGGCDQHFIHLLSLNNQTVLHSAGTSFAAPIVAEIMGRCNIADPLTAKALLISSAQHSYATADINQGYGIIPEDIEEILGCTENKITILYRKKMLPAHYAKLQIPIVKDLDYKGNVKISWTIAVASSINPLDSEDYTSLALEDTFYPHTRKYQMNKDGQTKMVNTETDQAIIQNLQDKGWALPRQPKSDSAALPQTEEERKKGFKWDAVLRKEVTKRYSSLYEPYLYLHGMERFTDGTDFIEYAVVVNIEYLSSDENIYEQTIEQYAELEAARVISRNELRI